MGKRVIRLCITLLSLLMFLLGACVSKAGPEPAPTTTPVTPSTTAPLPPQSSEPSLPITPTIAPTAVPSPIPQEYQALYEELSKELAQFELTLSQKWDRSQGQTVFATELAFANGNIGEGLLRPETLDNNRMLLDYLQAMGIKGVVLSIKYPLLEPTFPRSLEYLTFYKEVTAEARRHGMKVLVETGAIFAGTPYSPVQIDWSKYTSDSFLGGMRDQLVLIADEIKPDYLTLTEEPKTQEALTKLRFTLSDWSTFVESTLKRIDHSGGMLVGAGMGSWEDPAYATAFLSIPEIDYIDLHIYPPGKNGTLLERALNIALGARSAGKRVTIGESWLYKALPEEMVSGPGIGGDVFNRDVYSFWYPLDARFMKNIMDLADAADMDFVSFFWMRNFLTYLDYTASRQTLSTTELNRLINQTSLTNLQKNVLSPLGQYYQEQLHNRISPGK